MQVEPMLPLIWTIEAIWILEVLLLLFVIPEGMEPPFTYKKIALFNL